jgi:hypothetical protein
MEEMAEVVGGVARTTWPADLPAWQLEHVPYGEVERLVASVECGKLDMVSPLKCATVVVFDV